MSRLRRLLTIVALLVAATALTATPALARTKDHDHMPDRWEKRHHLNVKKDDSRRDRDRDGLSNYGEYRAHTNPRKKDSDHDGRRDGREDYDRDHLRNSAEIRTGFDPGDADSDNDGTKDGRENAGKIVKLSDTSITIKLAAGGSLNARLGDGLAVNCGAAGSGERTDAADDDAADPGEDAEDAPVPGEDDDFLEDATAADADADADTGDAADEPDTLMTRVGGEDDDEFDDAAFDQAFESEALACSAAKFKVGAVVHKAHVKRTASGPVVVSIKLVRTRR
jgi:hypothetical protein